MGDTLLSEQRPEEVGRSRLGPWGKNISGRGISRYKKSRVMHRIGVLQDGW